jgi:hypothetical protein
VWGPHTVGRQLQQERGGGYAALGLHVRLLYMQAAPPELQWGGNNTCNARALAALALQRRQPNGSSVSSPTHAIYPRLYFVGSLRVKDDRLSGGPELTHYRRNVIPAVQPVPIRAELNSFQLHVHRRNLSEIADGVGSVFAPRMAATV